jgi:hypothetical protein
MNTYFQKSKTKKAAFFLPLFYQFLIKFNQKHKKTEKEGGYFAKNRQNLHFYPHQ